MKATSFDNSSWSGRRWQSHVIIATTDEAKKINYPADESNIIQATKLVKARKISALCEETM